MIETDATSTVHEPTKTTSRRPGRCAEPTAQPVPPSATDTASVAAPTESVPPTSTPASTAVSSTAVADTLEQAMDALLGMEFPRWSPIALQRRMNIPLSQAMRLWAILQAKDLVPYREYVLDKTEPRQL